MSDKEKPEKRFEVIPTYSLLGQIEKIPVNSMRLESGGMKKYIQEVKDELEKNKKEEIKNERNYL